MVNDDIRINQTPNMSNSFSELLSRQLVKVAKAYEEKQVDYAYEKIIFEIYTEAISKLLDKRKNLLPINN
jgi:hypothetical protein